MSKQMHVQWCVLLGFLLFLFRFSLTVTSKQSLYCKFAMVKYRILHIPILVSPTQIKSFVLLKQLQLCTKCQKTEMKIQSWKIVSLNLEHKHFQTDICPEHLMFLFNIRTTICNICTIKCVTGLSTINILIQIHFIYTVEYGYMNTSLV